MDEHADDETRASVDANAQMDTTARHEHEHGHTTMTTTTNVDTTASTTPEHCERDDRSGGLGAREYGRKQCISHKPASYPHRRAVLEYARDPTGSRPMDAK